eukprot:5212923-Amphidinium_carterae.1
MKVVKLTSVVQDICKDNIEKTTEERVKLHMKWERKQCADPRLGDFPASLLSTRPWRITLARVASWGLRTPGRPCVAAGDFGCQQSSVTSALLF